MGSFKEASSSECFSSGLQSILATRHGSGISICPWPSPGVHVAQEVDEGRDVVVPEAVLHDLNKWPHMYEEELREYMFPTAVAAPEVDSADLEALGEHERLHRRWAAQLVTVSRG